MIALPSMAVPARCPGYQASMMAGMINRAAKVVVLADSSKFGRQLFARIGPLEIADYLVTERAPEGELAEALAAAGVEVITP